MAGETFQVTATVFLEGHDAVAADVVLAIPTAGPARGHRGPHPALLITRLNAIRRAHPALHRLRNLRFHRTDNDALIAYSKRSGPDAVLVVVNLDPHHTQEATISLDMPQLGLDLHQSVPVRDELTGRPTTGAGTNHATGARPGPRARLPRPAVVHPAPERRVNHLMTVNEPVPDTFEDTPAQDRDPDWFKRAVFYEVLVRSFQDSNGDGVGDLTWATA
ncbi:Alpha-1,4-glucan:maltose-1-phosphate maltosyltransferase [Streptomyces fumanus]